MSLFIISSNGIGAPQAGQGRSNLRMPEQDPHRMYPLQSLLHGSPAAILSAQVMLAPPLFILLIGHRRKSPDD